MKNIVLILILLPILSYTQKPTLEKAKQSLANYFKDDIPSLHITTNKTVFAPGEEIWFTAYAFNRDTNTIANKALNVIVELIDNNNSVISSQLLFLEKGAQNSSTLLSPDIENGVYYLKAFTSEMNKFSKDESFIQPIKIVEQTSNPIEAAEVESSYDIQIQPEGGHIVESINNTIGIKILNQSGKGVHPDKISLLELDKVIIDNILVNNLGMSRFEFVPNIQSDYQLKIEIDDQIVYKTLPKAEKKGVILKTNLNYISGHLKVILTTNTSTLQSLIDKPIALMLRKNKATKTYQVTFENGYPEITFAIPNSQLFSGINTLTVFNHLNQPILERVIFNHKSLKSSEAIVNVVKKQGDSFTYSLNSKLNMQSIKSNISISVLPKNTKAVRGRSNLLASVFLTPYTNGHLENSSYYFNNTFSQKKKFELDLLLLNQGWSKYSWENIFKNTIDNYYHSEPGITINGYVSTLDKTTPHQVFLYSKDNKQVEIVDIFDTNKFNFSNLNITNGSSFELVLTNTDGRTIKANFFYTISPKSKDRISRYDIISKANSFNEDLDSINITALETNTEQLDEVIINANKLKYGEYFKSWDSWKIDSTTTSIGNLSNFIGKYGYYRYWKEFDFSYGKIGYDKSGMDLIYTEPTIVVDGTPYLPSFSSMFSMQDIDEIYVNRKGNKNHTFIVFTNNRWKNKGITKTSRSFNITDEGFTKPKKFYTPNYNHKADSFESYGVLSWLPQLQTNDNGYISFSVYNPENYETKFLIEGFSDTGEPISNVVTVKNKTKP